jgi:hypothetical protein
MEPKDLALTHSGGVNVPETKLNIGDALQGQQEQLKRLIAQKCGLVTRRSRRCRKLRLS